MNPTDPPSDAAQASPAAPLTPAAIEQIRQEVEHLFRHSLRQGHINPLMHVIMAYRAHDLP